MRKDRLEQIEERIDKIQKALVELGEMRPGSISRQYNVCGNPKCRCKDVRNPRKHGPYYQLSYVHKGRSSSQFIRKEFLAETRQQISNYKKFKRLTEQWVSLALEHARLKLARMRGQ